MTELEKYELFRAQYVKGEYADAYITSMSLLDKSIITVGEMQVMVDEVRRTNPELLTRYEEV